MGRRLEALGREGSPDRMEVATWSYMELHGNMEIKFSKQSLE